MACFQWNTLAYCSVGVREFDLENVHSHPSRSSRPMPFQYFVRWDSWQRCQCAWPWNEPTKEVWLSLWASGPSGLMANVVPNLHPMLNPPLRSFLNVLSIFSAIPRRYFTLEGKRLDDAWKREMTTYSSPLCTMSAIRSVNPWWQWARKMPISSKMAHIHLVMSSFMFFHLSAHGF